MGKPRTWILLLCLLQIQHFRFPYNLLSSRRKLKVIGKNGGFVQKKVADKRVEIIERGLMKNMKYRGK